MKLFQNEIVAMLHCNIRNYIIVNKIIQTLLCNIFILIYKNPSYIEKNDNFINSVYQYINILIAILLSFALHQPQMPRTYLETAKRCLRASKRFFRETNYFAAHGMSYHASQHKICRLPRKKVALPCWGRFIAQP